MTGIFWEKLESKIAKITISYYPLIRSCRYSKKDFQDIHDFASNMCLYFHRGFEEKREREREENNIF